MQVQLETFDESMEEPTIPKAYRDMENSFSLSNANSLPLYWDEDHVIELEPGETPRFDLLYNLSDYQLKTHREYIDEKLQFSWICQLPPPICQKVFQNSSSARG